MSKRSYIDGLVQDCSNWKVAFISKFVPLQADFFISCMIICVIITAMSNACHGVSNYCSMESLLNRLFTLSTKKHQRSALLSLCGWNHQWLVDSPHKRTVTRKIFPFDDVIMIELFQLHSIVIPWILNCLWLYRQPLFWLFGNKPLYSAMPLWRGQFSHKYSQNSPHSSPVRARYGVSFVDPASEWWSAPVPLQYVTLFQSRDIVKNLVSL